MSLQTTIEKPSKTTKAFLISIALLILISILNWGVVSSFGKVKITRIKLIGDDGVEYSALAYVPKTATNSAPAPALLTIHGGSSNARNNESWSMEFARRGFVVIAVDNFGGGNSEYISKAGVLAAPEMFYELLLSMDIVDNAQIVTNGHSWGNDAAYLLGAKYNAAAVLISSGNNSTVAATYDGNLLQVFGGVENVTTVANYTANTVKSFASVEGLTIDNIVEGHVYGSFEEGNAKQMIISDKQVHEGAMVHTDTAAALLDFAQKAVTAPNYIDASDQIWMWKDVLGQLGIIAFIAFILTFTLLLVEKVPFFAAIRQPLPRNIGLRGKGFAISVIASLVFPLIVLYTGALGLWKLLGVGGMGLFKMRAGNFSFYTLAAICILGIPMFFLYHYTDGKKHKATLRDYGLTSENHTGLDFRLIGKSVLLAFVVIFTAWTYLGIQSRVLGTDFYCLYWGVKDIAAVKFIYYIPYIIIYSLCFIIASLGMNVERRLPSTGSETKDLALSMAFNALIACFTITAVILIQNALQHNMVGGGVAAMKSWGIEIVSVWGMPVGMAAAGAGQTFLYRKTGNVYPGAFIMGTYCALCCVLYAQTRI